MKHTHIAQVFIQSPAQKGKYFYPKPFNLFQSVRLSSEFDQKHTFFHALQTSIIRSKIKEIFISEYTKITEKKAKKKK